MIWQVIEYQDAAGKMLVARVPPNGTAELTTGSQLIVQEGQVATFYHDGRAADMFQAGRYTLATQNLPVLSKFLNLVAFGRSPFRSYVYFVALKTFINMRWGTASPILFEDKKYREIRLRGYGSFSLRVVDPALFLQTLVGTQGCETTDAVQQYLRRIIVSRLVQILPQVLTTIAALAQYYEEIAARTKTAVRDDFNQYGLELVDLLVEAIMPTERVERGLDEAAAVRAVGSDEVAHYERLARADALKTAATAGGGAAGDILTGALGLAAGVQMVREMVPATGAAGTATAPMTAASTTSGGPTKTSMEQIEAALVKLKEWADKGLIKPDEFEEKRKQLLGQI
jgi:membrane protease subunit (stomatin/prohibitin family)